MEDFSWVAIGLIWLCCCISFFFALSEAALFSLGPWKLKSLREGEATAARQLGRLMDEPRRVLATVVLGNTFANAGVVLFGMWFVRLEQGSLWLTIILLCGLVLIVCEVLPKSLGVRFPEAFAMRLVRPLALFVGLSRPFNGTVQWLTDRWIRRLIPSRVKPKARITEDEAEELIEVGRAHGVLEETEKEYISEILELDKRTAGEAMRARSDMASISHNLPVEKMVREAKRLKYRRLPLFDETPDTIVGILNTRDLLLDPGRDLSEMIDFPSFVPESMNLLTLLESFQKTRRRMAVVMDEFGTAVGFITLEDILEEVVGEIRTEGESLESEIEEIGKGSWRVKGTSRIENFSEFYPSVGEHEEIDTMGGLLCHLLGYVPQNGERAVYRGVVLRATKVDDRRVLELDVRLHQASRLGERRSKKS